MGICPIYLFSLTPPGVYESREPTCNGSLMSKISKIRKALNLHLNSLLSLKSGLRLGKRRRRLRRRVPLVSPAVEARVPGGCGYYINIYYYYILYFIISTLWWRQWCRTSYVMVILKVACLRWSRQCLLAGKSPYVGIVFVLRGVVACEEGSQCRKCEPFCNQTIIQSVKDY